MLCASLRIAGLFDEQLFLLLVNAVLGLLPLRPYFSRWMRTSSPSMARTSGDLVSGIGVVAEQWNREQDGDVERQKQGAGEGHTA